jgi:hypothetical protein
MLITIFSDFRPRTGDLKLKPLFGGEPVAMRRGVYCTTPIQDFSTPRATDSTARVRDAWRRDIAKNAAWVVTEGNKLKSDCGGQLACFSGVRELGVYRMSRQATQTAVHNQDSKSRK